MEGRGRSADAGIRTGAVARNVPDGAAANMSPSPSLGSSSSEGRSQSASMSASSSSGAAPLAQLPQLPTPTVSVVGPNSGPSALEDEASSVPLLGGEHIEASYPDLVYLCPYSVPGAVKGTMTVTNYKLYFRSSSESSSAPLILDVPLGFVSRIEKVGGQRTSSGENAYGLEIYCKDIRSLRFALSKVDGHPRKDIFETLRLHSFPLSYGSVFFAFQLTDKYNVHSSRDGWNIYDPVAELKRQGLPNESWKISNINSHYQFCETYPMVLGLPKSMTDEELMEAARFRTRNRIPVLSWMHPESLATITRCSQPQVGVSSNRSKADEKLVRTIMEANAQAHRIFIFDARPKLNSMVNVVNGGGYESEDVYTCSEFSFLDIHNIHVMRESLRKVREMCFPVIDDAKWLTNIEGTQWLHHLHCILSGAVRIADKVENGKASVLVHCSDGWDRTAQLTSLAMLLLDPYYRTLTGFEVLVEKEWMSFGHKFAHRIGHGVDKHNHDDRSPVFLQWIDCVWQVTNQFPTAFEFNEYFLTFVLDHLYSCLFGTFLFNSDKERQMSEVSQRSQSLWTFVNHKRDMFLNATYNPVAEGGGKIRAILPEASVRYMKLWTGYYCRWNPRMRPQDLVRQRGSQMQSITSQLKNKMDALKKELESKRRTKERESNSHFHVHQELLSTSHTTTVMATKYEPVNI